MHGVCEHHKSPLVVILHSISVETELRFLIFLHDLGASLVLTSATGCVPTQQLLLHSLVVLAAAALLSSIPSHKIEHLGVSSTQIAVDEQNLERQHFSVPAESVHFRTTNPKNKENADMKQI
mmetsp:Transcript_29910/g.43921  ORF Transcript_29910/g.43921 Transcript_29910/m.43921 type:complete len:122 (+) Transcript_29910:105-470(+)